MPEKTRALVTVLCDNIVQNRLKSCLSSDFFDLFYFNNIEAFLTFMEKQDVDVLIVDSSHNKADLLFQTIQPDNTIPIGLLVRSDDMDWKNFGRWKVDSFIPAESSNLELTARIKAIVRRATKLAIS